MTLDAKREIMLHRDESASGLCAFSPCDDGPPVPVSKEAAELCGMLESAIECTGAAIVPVPFSRVICERVAAACEAIASTGELSTPALLMLFLRGAHEALGLGEILELCAMCTFIEGPMVLRDRICAHLASVLWALETPGAVCAQFCLESDLEPAERAALSREPPWAPPLSSENAGPPLLIGESELPADSVGEVMLQCEPRALLMLKGVSRSWGDLSRRALLDKGWAQRNGLAANWGDAAQLVEQRLRQPFHELVACAELSTPNSGVGDAEAGGIGALLIFGTALTQLDLHHNSIGDEGAIAIASALSRNRTVSSLLLGSSYGGNMIGPTGATALARALHSNSTLTQLHLNYNEVGAAGATAFARALEANMTLTELNLCGNDIETEGAIALADALLRNSTLAVLEVNENEIDQEGARAFARCLRANTALTELKCAPAHQTRRQLGDRSAHSLCSHTCITRLSRV